MTERPPKQSLKLVSRRGFDPPRPLGKHGMSLWCRITSAYNVADAGGVELLTLACQALDRAERLREQIDADGEIVRYRTGMREHPALRGELANRALVSKLLVRVGLDMEVSSEPPRTVGRPPSGGVGVTRDDLEGGA